MVIYATLIARFLIKNNSPTPLSNMRALSFHKIATISHRKIPMTEKIKSTNAHSGTPRILIAISTNADATHLIYQSRVYLGVADLKIRLELANSSLENSWFLDKLDATGERNISFLYLWCSRCNKYCLHDNRLRF